METRKWSVGDGRERCEELSLMFAESVETSSLLKGLRTRRGLDIEERWLESLRKSINRNVCKVKQRYENKTLQMLRRLRWDGEDISVETSNCRLELKIKMI